MPRKNEEVISCRKTKTLEGFLKRNDSIIEEVEYDPDSGIWIWLKKGFLFDGYFSRSLRGSNATLLIERFNSTRVIKGEVPVDS